ncbi:hypothetical protein [Ruficoccus sp. ZRK36]|uniref:hypothetical protein n=1 Tax=Ruficoccus sp. ZRK36 TaxID=2866311 RepID=UPI001C739672|nr:hypothetical protein [Ruficoccus sp. ZRK36]QYY34648.1 hypothetical protein K0V07_10065 [Ruficoccus sp. ZRK36]
MDTSLTFAAYCFVFASIGPVVAFALGVRAIRSAKSPAERKAILRMFEVLVSSLPIWGRGRQQRHTMSKSNERVGE